MSKCVGGIIDCRDIVSLVQTDLVPKSVCNLATRGFLKKNLDESRSHKIE